MSMRTVCAVTVARSDYGILRPVLRRLSSSAALRLRVVAGGSHLLRSAGHTIDEVAHDGFEIAERVEMLLASDGPEAISASIGVGVLGFARAYERMRPDVLLLIGDRFEMLAAAVASLPFTIPIAHIHGGELSTGAIDDQIRHAITKMSHLHFVATPACAARVTQMGEEPWRVTVSGAPAIDDLAAMPRIPVADLEAQLGVAFDPPPLVVTYHPATLAYEQTAHDVAELVEALRPVDRSLIITHPNADTLNGLVLAAWRRLADGKPGVALVENLGSRTYWSVLAAAGAMVGNSSSGLIEAPSFQLPVVNIGNRQAGRDRAANVIDTGPSSGEIAAALERALSPAFRQSLAGLVNPFGDGLAAGRIAGVLETIPLDARLRLKSFHTPAVATHA